MKSLLILAASVFYLNTVISQKIPSYRKIDKSDIEMTDCDFDKGAEAVKLIDYATMLYDRGTEGMTLFKTMYDYRVRIKILKDKGLSYANVEIPYYNYNNDEKITHIDACTYNLDENGKVKITDVGKSSIYTKKVNKRYSRLIIAFPEVKIGSVIEYRYRLESEYYLDIRPWYFQDEIPTRYSEYEVNIPLIFRFTPQPTITGNVDVKEKIIEDVVSVGNDAYRFKILHKNYIMQNLIGIRDEPFMGSPRDYKQRIEFQLSQIDHGNYNIENYRTGWADVIKLLNKDEDFGQQLINSAPAVEPLIQEALKIEDKNKRIVYLFNEIRTKMTCSDKESKYADEGINSAWKKKTGNSADINLMLISALNKSGVKAYPILLSTRENGLVNSWHYSLNQFNVVMAYIKTDNGFLVLDATDKVSNYKLTPGDIVNTRGFVVDDDSGKWIDVINNDNKYQVMVALQGNIDDKGVMTGECSVNCSGYARKQRVDKYLKDAEDFKQQYFIKPYPAVSVKEIVVSNTQADSLPLSQKITFSVPLNNSGEYGYFNTNLFNDLETNPFIEENRTADIDFGFQQEYIIYGNFTIPEGYVYETLPENISMSMPGRGIQYSRIMNATGNTLNLKITVDFRQPFYLASTYGDFHEFYKKLMNSLSEQVVIKKK